MTTAPQSPRRRGTRQHRERGSVSVFAVIITMAVVVFFGAVIDFEQALEARQDANTVAQEAARAAAGRVDVDRAYTSGELIMDRQSAISSARAYLNAGGYRGDVTTAGSRTIRVHVALTRPALFLPVIGITHLHADAVATATLITGVRGPHRP
ncbi:pilus assembly protein TadG-related protein [Actinomadura litoris]|uniref:Putative Flp pilus-assembly TadG-like N-terminal domain-containing protein n=1 Tax=Actinomadura litoris TaxID=2678616 RepID=A0A7K1KT64_9ACTN|nr:pilus assembly protein TadG-related protein [Actinomadura litoris]MUN35380.1 hypothetical protein [Actinomadura litoris]